MKIERMSAELEELKNKPLQLAEGVEIERPVHIHNITVSKIAVLDGNGQKRIVLNIDEDIGRARIAFFDEYEKKNISISSAKNGKSSGIVLGDTTGHISIGLHSLLGDDGTSSMELALGDYGKYDSNDERQRNILDGKNEGVYRIKWKQGEHVSRDTHYLNGQLAHRALSSKNEHSDMFFAPHGTVFPKMFFSVFGDNKVSSAKMGLNGDNGKYNDLLMYSDQNNQAFIKSFDINGTEIVPDSKAVKSNIWEDLAIEALKGGARAFGQYGVNRMMSE